MRAHPHGTPPFWCHVADFAPDLVIISAGFDAAEGDPIGGCHLTPDIYAHMTSMLQAVAPTVALLEGGYNLIATAAATEATLRVLLGERPPSLPAGHGATPAGMSAVAQAVRIQSRYWPCLQSLVGAFSRFLEPTPAVRHAPAMGLGVQLPRPFSATGVHSTPFVEEDDSALDEVYEYEGDSDKGGDEGEEEDYGGDEEAAWGNPAACDVPDNLCSGPLFAEALPSLPSLALGQEDDVGRLGPKPWAVTPAAGAAEADDPEEHGVENNPSAAATAVDPKPAAQLDKTSSPAAALLRPSPGDAGVRVSPVPDVIRAATPEDGPSDDSEGIKTGGPPRAHAARLWQRAALKAMVMKRSGKHGIRLHGLPSNVQTYCPGKPDA